MYNNEDAFHLSEDYVGAYRAPLNANLAFYDGLDGKTDWPLDAQGNHPLTELLLADHLIVDVSKSFDEMSYFKGVSGERSETGWKQKSNGYAFVSDDGAVIHIMRVVGNESEFEKLREA